ncbi:MAG TPA: glycosyltransferase family 9 protein [Verrucomicrobiae bacterium]
MKTPLIVYLHGIGDNIMLSGVIKEYCRRRQIAKVDLVVLNPGCAAIWRNNPLVGQVTVYPHPQPHFWNPVLFYGLHQWKVRRWIREFNRDGRYQEIIFSTIQTLPEILYHVTGTYGRHKIDRVCRELGLAPTLHPYDLYPSTTEEAEAARLAEKFSGRRLAVIHPFSGHTKKRLGSRDVTGILESLRAQGYLPLIVGSSAESRRLDPAWQAQSVFGLELGVLIALLKRAEIFAGTDSAVAHLAAFANVPRLLIFSPKLKPSRYLPLTERGQIHLIKITRNDDNDIQAKFLSHFSETGGR